MKKAYIYGEEKQTLYYGITSVYGEFILTTNGDPTCLNELEDANDEDCDALIASIQEIISDPATCWERCNEEDEEYIFDTLRAWGLM